MSTASFLPTEEDLLAAKRLQYRRSLRSGRVWRSLAGGGAILAAFGFMLNWMVTDSPSLWMPVLVFLGWAAFLALILFSNYLQISKRVHRTFVQQKAFHEAIDVEWTEEGITFRSSRGFGNYSWDDFLDAVEDRDVIILFQSDELMNFIPKRVLDLERAQAIMSFWGRRHRS